MMLFVINNRRWKTTWDLKCVYDKDHMSALRIKDTSESDPHSYEVTQAVTNKAQKQF